MLMTNDLLMKVLSKDVLRMDSGSLMSETFEHDESTTDMDGERSQEMDETDE